ncbi:PREDICTED: uncharacterized protein LOC108779170 [Cyphomyrmex costatus]|uniref:uncharacterized protein LOC108779170 n=1 Tax=Cyphomyrmex costatus TaxID=456900 RepID=UPI0008522D51|nr:PREDICTED: uncharacterized protein LOC108779170 [Cyphomyrmex costatus]
MNHTVDARKLLPTKKCNKEINKMLDIVMSDCRLKLREIVEMVGISEERVFHILHDILGMRKLMSRWVPRLLTVENKRVHMIISKKMFFVDMWTVDETCIHYYIPETKQQSKQWISSDEPAPKKAESVSPTGKVMAIFLGF